jgi:hypothetical protein
LVLPPPSPEIRALAARRRRSASNTEAVRSLEPFHLDEKPSDDDEAAVENLTQLMNELSSTPKSNRRQSMQVDSQVAGINNQPPPTRPRAFTQPYRLQHLNMHYSKRLGKHGYFWSSRRRNSVWYQLSSVNEIMLRHDLAFFPRSEPRVQTFVTRIHSSTQNRTFQGPVVKDSLMNELQQSYLFSGRRPAKPSARIDKTLEKMMNKDPVKPISLETFEEEMGMRFTSHATSKSYKVTKNRRSKLRNIIKEGEPAIRLPKGVRLEPVVNKQGEKVLARPSAEPRARRGSLAHEARRRKSINR